MQICVINPTTTSHWNKESQRIYSAAARPDTQVSVVSLEWGTPSIESYRDEALVVPNILTKIIQAQKEGADAVIIDCMSDPGLYPARELVSIPVIGPAEACMHLAAILGHRFSFLGVSDQDIAEKQNMADRYGLAGRLASVRPFNIPVLALEDDPEYTLRTIIQVSEQAVREDDAHVIIPGCTGLAGLAPHVQAALAEKGCEVPVLDPPVVAVKLAESLVDMGQSHSRRTYACPPAKTITWPTQALFG